MYGLHHDEAQDTIRVLHVDKEPDQIRPAKLFIEKADPAIQIDLVSSLKKAQHLLQQQSYDCVLSDYLFTGMNGVTLARIVKETNNIPFIIYTGQNDEDMAGVVFATEIDDYIRKEFNPNHYLMLAKKIRAIVEKYRVEKRLQELEKWFRYITEYSYDVTFTLDKGGCFTYVSPSVERISGYTPEEIVGSSFKNFVPKSLIPKVIRAFNKVMKGLKIEGLKLELIRKNKTNSSIEINAFPLIRNGKVFGVQGIFRDLADIKSEDEKVKESEMRWRTFIELAPDGIILGNMKGVVTAINTAYTKLTGFTEDDIVGKYFTNIGVLQMSDVPLYIKIVSSLLRGKNVKPFEFRYKRKDGSIGWGEAHCRLIEIGGGKKELIGICRDITQRKQDENILRDTLDELERSNRELDDYTYAVSHDLKAPLRSIEAFSGFLLEDYAEKLDETGKDYLKRVNEATIRMKNFIDDLLLISRVGRKHTELEMVDLYDVIKAIKLEYESVLKERQANIMSEKLPILKTYKVWIKQLFSNLISNGLKFNKSPDPTVWVSFEERLNEYMFSVRDNGIGIDKKYHEQIFNIFQRLHSQDEYPGTGAGLTICKKIVESFGGKIWLESNPGKGSTFYFTHPKDVSNRLDESEVQLEMDQSMTEVQEEIPVHRE